MINVDCIVLSVIFINSSHFTDHLNSFLSTFNGSLTIAMKCNSIMLSIVFEAWFKEKFPILQQNIFFASQNPISYYSLSKDDPETLIKMRKNDCVFSWIDAINIYVSHALWRYIYSIFFFIHLTFLIEAHLTFLIEALSNTQNDPTNVLWKR